MRKKRGKIRLKYLIDIAILFLYVYDISFIFFPSIFRTRVIVSIIGFFIFVQKNRWIVPRSLLKLVGVLLLSLLPILLTTTVNNHFDPRFLGNLFQNVLYIFGAYYISIIRGRGSIKYILSVVSLAILSHNLLALLMYISPTLLNYVIKIQRVGGNFEYAINNTMEFGSRFIGIGLGSYFLGGIISSIGLLLIAYLIHESKKNKVYWLIAYIFVAFTGIYIARITFLGIFLSCLYFANIFLSNRKRKTSYKKLMFSTLVILAIGSTYVYNNFEKISSSNSFRHSFELFINFYESGNLTTSSTRRVKAMTIFPKDFKTLLLGDAKFNNEDGSYYMFTDVGYSRILFYYGIIGMFFYFLIPIHLNKKIKKIDFTLNKIVFYLLALLFIGNLKGLLEINWLLFLLFWAKPNILKVSYHDNISRYKQPKLRRSRTLGN